MCSQSCGYYNNMPNVLLENSREKRRKNKVAVEVTILNIIVPHINTQPFVNNRERDRKVRGFGTF